MRLALQRILLALCAIPLALMSLSPPVALATATEQGADDETIPVPNNTALADRDRRLADKGMTAGSPMMIRIFKSESELELWINTGQRFELFHTYRICNWSGTLGPKLHEGDRQAPEGFYSVSLAQIHRKGRWPRSLNIGFPNSLDRAVGRTGSLILVHGGCTSTGCYAMTNPVMEEIYGLAEQALRGGQERIPVHVFPFRMSDANMKAHADQQWHDFWLNLKEAYDRFEQARVPPKIDVCDKRYVVREASDGEGEVEAHLGATCQPLDVAPLAIAEGTGTIKAKHGRKVASRARARRSAGRNARKAYAAARRARMAAHGKHVRSAAAVASKRAR
jgi:murein L,D-transpeptidase YafK